MSKIEAGDYVMFLTLDITSAYSELRAGQKCLGLWTLHESYSFIY